MNSWATKLQNQPKLYQLKWFNFNANMYIHENHWPEQMMEYSTENAEIWYQTWWHRWPHSSSGGRYLSLLCHVILGHILATSDILYELNIYFTCVRLTHLACWRHVVHERLAMEGDRLCIVLADVKRGESDPTFFCLPCQSWNCGIHAKLYKCAQPWSETCLH